MVSRSSLLRRTALGAGMTGFFAPLVDGPGVAEAAGLRTELVLVGGFGAVDEAGVDAGCVVEGAVVVSGGLVVEGVICATGAAPAGGDASVDGTAGASCMDMSEATEARVVPAVALPRPLPLPLPRPLGAAGALGGMLRCEEWSKSL